MNINLMIDAIVRQTTILIAQLATSARARAPLDRTANQVFSDGTTWTNLGSTDLSRGRFPYFAYDADHHVLYVSASARTLLAVESCTR